MWTISNCTKGLVQAAMADWHKNSSHALSATALVSNNRHQTLLEFTRLVHNSQLMQSVDNRLVVMNVTGGSNTADAHQPT